MREKGVRLLLQKDILPLILSAAAGSATMIGAFLAVAKRPDAKQLAFALGFSGGVMTAVSLLDLLPQGIAVVLMTIPGIAGAVACCCACSAGMLTARLLDMMLPEQQTRGLLRLGIFSALAVTLHNFPEGVAVFLSAGRDTAMGIRLCAAIALHNIPEGITVAMPVWASGKSKGGALILAALSALSEPMGAIAAMLFLRPFITESGLALIFCGIAGLMTAISFGELFANSLCGKNGKTGAFGALCGVIIMLFNCCLGG